MALRDDLSEFGFSFVNSPSLDPDFALEMAVREFQRYARMDNVARDPGTPVVLEYWARLVQQPTGGSRYTGDITGDATDAATLAAVQYWKDNQWRCPVVVLAFSFQGTARQMVKQNVWLRDEIKGGKETRFFVRDLSGVYVPPQTPDQIQLIGRFFASPKQGGPVSLPNLGALTSITPELLLGHAASAAEKPTYKAVRTVAEMECAGRFDCLNAWDNSFISLGTCHWTIGRIVKQLLSMGELGGYLAYLRRFEPAAYHVACEMWGVFTEREWGDTGAALFNKSQRKYETHLQELNKRAPGIGLENIVSEAEANFLRNWHWFYRFESAARTNAPLQERMWDMTRIRLRDVLGAAFTGANALQFRNPDGTLRAATIGDIYTTELSVAWLLRWHVKRPGDVVAGGVAGAQITGAVADAKISGKIVNDWPTTAQPCLREKLRARATTMLGKDVERVVQFVVPGLGQLSQDPGSFTFFGDGLPPAPWSAAATPAPFNVTSMIEPLVEQTAAAATGGPAGTQVVQGFAKGVQIYAAASDGTTIQDWFRDSLGNWRNAAPPDPLRHSIDRLGFFDGATLLFVWPVLGDEFSKLRTDNAGSPNATLKIEGKIRCLVFEQDADYLDFSIQLDHSIAGMRLRQFELDVLGQLPNPVALNEGGLATVAFTAAINGGSNMPDLPTQLGLRGSRLLPQFPFPFMFQLVKTNSPTAGALFQVQFRQFFPLTGDRQRITPFLMDFDPGLMLLDAQNNPCMPIQQIQPPGETAAGSQDGRVQWMLHILIPQRGALEAFNRIVTDPVLQALDTVQAGNPVSFAPEFISDDSASGTRPFWDASFAVIDRGAAQDVDFHQGWPGAAMPDGQATFLPRLLQPRSQTPEVYANAAFPGVRSTHGIAVSSRFAVLPRPTVLYPDTDLTFSPTILFGLRQIKPDLAQTGPNMPLPGTQLVRIGALDLGMIPDLRPVSVTSGDVDGYKTSFADESRIAIELAGSPSGTVGARSRSLHFTLAVTTISPGGQDDVPGEDPASDPGYDPSAPATYEAYFERKPAVVVAQEDDTLRWQAPFAVTVREVTGPGASQNVQLVLVRAAGQVNSAPSHALVIDQQPFFAGRVETGQFQTDLSLSVSDEIGNWSNSRIGGAGWAIGADASGVQLTLPPQGVGEAMHRRIGSGDITPGEPADFRFSPNALLNLNPAYFKQRFTEPPWNLRRVLGYPGQSAPGAGLTSVEYELFYGMYGRFAVRNTRISEIQARLGRPAGRQPVLLPWRYRQEQDALYFPIPDELGGHVSGDVGAPLRSGTVAGG